MKAKKILFIFACLMSAALLYVFGSMYVTNKDQAGGAGSSNTTTASSGSGDTNSNNASPGNNGSSSDQTSGGNQTANPSGAPEQQGFNPDAQQQSIPMPTQPINAPRQTSSGTTNGVGGNMLQQQSQNNSVNISQPQITQNPMSGMQ